MHDIHIYTEIVNGFSWTLVYLNKENRKLLKKLGIVCHCLPLGRPKKNPDPEEEKLRRKASGERNGVEATFGTAKRVYRANNIRAKLKETARIGNIPQIAANSQYYWCWWLFRETMCYLRRMMNEFI